MTVLAPRPRAVPRGALAGRFHTGLVTTGDMIVLAVQASRAVVVDIATRRFSWSEFLFQAWFMTRVSLLPTILVAIPFGVIVSVQVGGVAQQIGAAAFSGAVNGIGVLRQGAPMVTSLMIAGAVGAALCSDLGARTIREEVDALRVMGINPVNRLVAPRLLAAVVVALLLNVIVAISAIGTGYLLNVVAGRSARGPTSSPSSRSPNRPTCCSRRSRRRSSASSRPSSLRTRA